jgi:hypothetical protein
MAKVTVETANGGEDGGEAIDDDDDAEAAEAQADTVETVADASVEIAKVEAERDVKIAEIAADAGVQQTQAMADAATAANTQDTELRECRDRIASLETGLSNCKETLALIQQQLSPPPPPNPPQSEPADGLKENGATPGATITPKDQTPPEEPKKKRRAVRWI